ncbi:hypothetical protein I6F35_33940 [Bradyrhizobium sp. BRP22]|uniref:hypothetical protein n=1 Tax=Bradyrhizobium sp. BRP22 TaxID=2793821 RepID=UPI001CD218BC|nr:hypothetical protein [Bradyrhizobium sp. BRP22]MCA1458137.1 hypothetical protein [Bradyrhizobium sp. BRP22]
MRSQTGETAQCTARALRRQAVEQRQHDRGIRHRQHRVDTFDQARLQQCIARLADGAERAAA